jgi:hypothetical protein
MEVLKGKDHRRNVEAGVGLRQGCTPGLQGRATSTPCKRVSSLTPDDVALLKKE